MFDEFASLSPSYRGLNYDCSRWREGLAVPPSRECGHPARNSTSAGKAHSGTCRRTGPVRRLASRRRAGAASSSRPSSRRPKELPDAEFPLVLNTGRVLEHWHTGTMTRRGYALDALEPAPFVEVHPTTSPGSA